MRTTKQIAAQQWLIMYGLWPHTPIRELQDKGYGQLLGNKTLDFVIMCIPLEPAYQLALQNDKDLLYDLAKTNV